MKYICNVYVYVYKYIDIYIHIYIIYIKYATLYIYKVYNTFTTIHTTIHVLKITFLRLGLKSFIPCQTCLAGFWTMWPLQ